VLSDLNELSDVQFGRDGKGKDFYLYLGEGSQPALTNLKGLENLEEIDVATIGSDGLTSLDGLGNVTTIRTLAVSSNTLTSLSDLTALTDVSWLRVTRAESL